LRLNPAVTPVTTARRTLARQNDFIENIDDDCIQYDGGRVAANESLITEIRRHGLRRTTRRTGLDRKTIRAILTGKKVKISTLTKVVVGLRAENAA